MATQYTPAHLAAASDSVAAIQCIQCIPGASEAKGRWDETLAGLAERGGDKELAQCLQLTSKCNDLVSAAMLQLPQRVERLRHDGADPTTQLVHQQNTYTAPSLALGQQC